MVLWKQSRERGVELTLKKSIKWLKQGSEKRLRSKVTTNDQQECANEKDTNKEREA
jgi:hypothetical protein